MKFDFESLYQEASGEAFKSGKRRYYDDKVSHVVHIRDGKKNLIEAEIKGAQAEPYKAEVVFDERGGLYDYSCTCGNASLENGPCRHIVAAALLYEEKHPDSILQPGEAARAGTPGDRRTDMAVLNLAQEYSRRKNSRFSEYTGEKISLIPILVRNGERLKIRFQLGAKKQYNLKDISDFVTAYYSYTPRRYGALLEFIPRDDSFTAESVPLLHFLLGCYFEKRELLEAAGSSKDGDSKEEISLTGSEVDEFYELYKGQLIRFDDAAALDGYRLLEKESDTLALWLDVSREANGFIIKDSLGSFFVVTGKKQSYIVTPARILPVSHDFTRQALPLIKTVQTHGSLFVEDRDMELFYNSVLGYVAPHIQLRCADGIDLAQYEAPPFSAELFINPYAGGGIRAELKCRYDETAVDIFDDNCHIESVRDWETEAGLKELLHEYFPSTPELTLTDPGDIYCLMNEGLKMLYNYADIYLSDDVSKMKVRRSPRIRVGVRLESDLLKVDLDAPEFTPDELSDILGAYREKRKFVRLSDGSFVDLSDPSVSVLSDILEGTQKKDGELVMPRFYAPFLEEKLRDGFFILERDAGFKELIQNLTGAKYQNIEVPPHLKSVMRNYQKTGYRWLTTLSRYGFGGILADDMGLGKSLQIIALLAKENRGTSIIVCPTTLILNWANEFEKFAPSLSVLPVIGNFEERQAKIRSIDSYRIVITSYELFRRDEEYYQEHEFVYAIADEAQYIKNPETKNARTVKSVNAERRFALTGTPIENSLSELWSIFDFIMPGYLFSYSRFKEKFETGVVYGDADSADRLKKLVSPFILRRLKKEVLPELPKKTEISIESPLEGEQKRLYEANLALIRDSVKSTGENINKIVVLSMLTKLRQICCEPRLVYPDYDGNSAKLDTLMELVRSAVSGGHRILLFSQFTSMLDIIKKKLTEDGITHFILKGDTLKSERMRLVNRFNASDTKVFLISLKAGGTGLNLTGADTVIHYDPWWNESVMNQATDRAYRIGQEKAVNVYKLTLKDTIEQKILALQEKKTTLSALVTEATGQDKLSYKQIMEILKDI